MRIFQYYRQLIFTSYMVKGFVILFCLCMGWTGVVFSQQRYSIYQSMNTSSGLPSNYVFASAEDENGFLWIGTDKGLFRYDGFRWQVWDRDNGLPGNYINTVLSDKRGGLWLSISEKGFFHFDPSTNAVRTIAFKAMPLLHSLQTDEEGNLFAEVPGSTHTAYLLHPGQLQNPEVIFESDMTGPLLKGDAKAKKVYCVSSDQSKLLEAKRTLRAKWPLKPVLIGKQLSAQPVYYVSDSIILTSTHYYRFDTAGRMVAEEELFEPGNSYAFSCAAAEGLYVYNVKTGYYFFDREGKKTFYDKSSGLGTDHVNHIYQAKDRTVIISTLGAGVQFIKNNYRKTYYTNNNTVKSIVPAGADWYVLNSNNIYKTTGKGAGLTMLGPVAPSNLNLFLAGDTLMVGTLQGIYFYKEGNASLRSAGFLELTAGISSIIKQNGHLLAGTYGGGLLRFQSSRLLARETGYPFRIVERLVPLSMGFAALSYEDGLQLTDTSTGHHVHLTQKNGLPSNSVYTVYERNDSLWIGTKGGLVVYEKGKVAQAFRFPPHAAQERPLTCFHDAMNRLWVVSTSRLYEAKDGRLMPLSSYPLVGENDMVTAASYNNATNELAIGSDKTFSIISLNNIHADTFVQPPRLTRIVLDNAAVADSSFDIPYHFNVVRFSLSALSALPFSRNHIYYQLRGLSNEWKEVKDSLMISFAGLRPGRYSLWVKTINADGYESAEVRLASFSVKKPFWQSWLFIGLCMLLIMSITIFAVRQLEKKKRRRKEAGLMLRQSLQRERERIAKDLHDHLGTNLVTMVAQADHIEHRLHKGDLQTASATLQHLSEQTRATMNVLRETVWAVQETEHSLSEFILRIRSFLQRLFETTPIEWTVASSIEKEILLSPAQTLHLFRIVQEASQNILKHAGASRAHYSFSLQGSRLQLIIEDNGKGFTAPAGSTNGLINIEERVQELMGTVTINTLPSVHIQIQIPIQIR